MTMKSVFRVLRRLLCHIHPFSGHYWAGRTLRLTTGSAYIPKHANAEDSNNTNTHLREDCHFVCEDYCTIGVSDGGIDAGKQAQQLMYNAFFSVNSHGSKSEVDIDPSVVVKEAFMKTDVQGSPTACVITLTRDNFLRGFNVGDCGFVVIRRRVMVYTSQIIEKRFSNVGKEFEFEAKAGDIIVAATNGLVHNVFKGDIVRLVNQEVHNIQELPEELARRLAEFASDRAKDLTSHTPFDQMNASMRAGYTGGRYNDITVIVAVVFPV